MEKSRTTDGNDFGLCLVSAIYELHSADLLLSENHSELGVYLKFLAFNEA